MIDHSGGGIPFFDVANPKHVKNGVSGKKVSNVSTFHPNVFKALNTL